MKKLTIDEFQQRLNVIHPTEQLKAVSYTNNKLSAVVQCQKCKTLYTKIGNYFLDKRKISICKNCYPTHTNKLRADFVPLEGYKLMEEYKGMHNKVLIQHLKCGFIWSMTPNNLQLGKGCPKCNKRVSKGEQKIIKWLKSTKTPFIFQHKIEINNHHLVIDFYLPKQDLYIEYNGEQHYNSVAFFGGKKKFHKQIVNDKLKKETLKEKLLIISYLDFENIESILESSTTIPAGSML